MSNFSLEICSRIGIDILKKPVSWSFSGHWHELILARQNCVGWKPCHVTCQPCWIRLQYEYVEIQEFPWSSLNIQSSALPSNRILDSVTLTNETLLKVFIACYEINDFNWSQNWKWYICFFCLYCLWSWLYRAVDNFPTRIYDSL